MTLLFSQAGKALFIIGGVVMGAGLLCIGVGFLATFLYNRKHKSAKNEDTVDEQTN